MSSSIEYVEFICEQIRNTGAVRYRKMFGDYMVYVDDKPLLLVCDNVVYVKELDCVRELMKQADKGIPYNGAKEHYILDVENVELSENVIAKLLPVVNIPVKKNRAKKKI